jgi:hypothetical protein
VVTPWGVSREGRTLGIGDRQQHAAEDALPGRDLGPPHPEVGVWRGLCCVCVCVCVCLHWGVAVVSVLRQRFTRPAQGPRPTPKACLIFAPTPYAPSLAILRYSVQAVSHLLYARPRKDGRHWGTTQPSVSRPQGNAMQRPFCRRQGLPPP